MKTKILMLSILTIFSITTGFAQDRTTVSANNSEISDNLDLRAVASIFGDSRDLEDFERRLNDPKVQISNLDLNQDNQVDYLRVIESIEGNAHLIVIQSVLGRDTFQDVATVEVERDRFNRVQVQVVGDVYMYGNNYIYEPDYAFTPIIYNSFWLGKYTPYCSSWYWGFYPNYYYSWSPFSVFRYRSNIGFCINNYHNYNYVNYRRCEVAYNSYRGRRGNAYETQYPNRSFSSRNENFTNRYELANSRNINSNGTRNNSTYNNTRNYTYNTIPSIENSNSRSETTRINTTRNYNSNENNNVRGNSNPRNETTYGYTTRNYNSSANNIRSNSNSRSETQRAVEPTRNNSSNESVGMVNNQRTSPREYPNSRNETNRITEPQRENSNSSNSQRNPGSREYSIQRENSGRNESNSRGNKRS